MVRERRGQISLEFLFVFGLLMILLLYSIRNVSFSEGSPSAENLKIQVALEEKGLANAISNTISQVYAQGPGSKATASFRFTYLKNEEYVKRASGLRNPELFITYCNLPEGGYGTYVLFINETNSGMIHLDGENKNAFFTRSLFPRRLSNESDAWLVLPDKTTTIFILESPLPTPFFSLCGLKNKTKDEYYVYGVSLKPSELPSHLKIVVEWNPDEKNLWVLDKENDVLRININPGEK